MDSEARRGRRVACNDKCLLVFKGDFYSCKLENISISGVLVRCDDTIPASISPGDSCGLLLCRDPKICPGEYPARVTRLDTSKVALQFLDI
ncbi:MAG: PilZ domain-containing protein [Desulfuromonadales bacterium]|nr:PilZ domain-containing protein [Desulfuromonadales bacterium]